MKTTIRGTLIGATALSALAFAPTFVAAQAAPATTPAPANKVDTVVVTGSRISRSTFSSTSPLQIITNENAVLSGSIDAAEILQGSTAAAGSTQINNFFTGFVVEGGPGVQTVGLNSLGAQRTLLLINGRRLPPSGTRGQVNAVDLATIPNIAVSRYEILNDGASPIYGSDAVGGVINAVTRKDVNGLEITGGTSTSFEGGGSDFSVGALWGKTEDRWNVMVTGEYFRQEALKYNDRDFCLADYVFNPTTGERADFIDPTTGQPKCLGIGFSHTRISPLGAAQTGTGTFIPDASVTARTTGVRPDATVVPRGTPVPFGPSAGNVSATIDRCVLPTGQVLAMTGAATANTCTVLLTVPGYRRLFSPKNGVIGLPLAYQSDLKYGHPLVDGTDIISPSERINLYATFGRDLDVLGGIEVYGEALYANRKSDQTRGAQIFPTVAATNVYNTFGVAVQPVIARPANNSQDVTTWQALLGARGQTGNGFMGLLKNGKWDAYYSTSSADGDYDFTSIRTDRLNATLATTITGGVASCPTPTVSGGACVPINWFDPRVVAGNWTEAEYDYLFGSENTGNTVYKQKAFEANISGELFEIPKSSGPIKANVGVYWREYSINDVPGKETLANNVSFTSAAGITKGTDAVKEVYGEVIAPLLARLPLVQNLEVTGAYRFTDYDSYESNSTWKATANWKITPEFALIASAGTSYRAPALFELFLGNQTGFLGQTSIDPCINWGLSNNPTLQQRCGAAGIPNDYNGAGSSATIFTGGGAGTLKEEESRSDIFSFLYTPTAINLSVRIDSWKIKVTDQVANFGAASIVNACYTDETGKAAVFCSLLTRNGATGTTANPNPFNILTVKDNYVNINVTEVEGIDLTLIYTKDFSFGTFTIDSRSRWTLKNENGLFSDTELSDYAGDIGDPVFVDNTQLRFKRKDWTYAWTVSAVGPSSYKRYRAIDVALAAGSNYTYQGLTTLRQKIDTETTITHGLNVQYKTDNWTVVGGISNIFDEAPPSVSTGIYFARLGTAPLASQYDFVGRSANLSVIRRF